MTYRERVVWWRRSATRHHRLSDSGTRFSGARLADPKLIRVVLSRSLGVTQTVEKTRVLYLVGQTRVHLDSVDVLGDFLE